MGRPPKDMTRLKLTTAAPAALLELSQLPGVSRERARMLHEALGVNDLDELVDMGVLLASAAPILRQRRLERTGIIEISGGGKELSCDTCDAAGVELPELTEAGALNVPEGHPRKPFRVAAAQAADPQLFD